jgi:putative NIF3 family GTP cyclohydrolase 1 type 2
LKLREFFRLAIQAGIDADPRGRTIVEQELQEARKVFEELKPEDRAAFDQEKLENPYTDSRILYGNPDQDVKTVLAGIDIETAELLLADRLIQKGKGIDLVAAHHPEGRAFANFYEVMKMQADILNHFGVPINVAEDQLSSRMKDVERSLMPANHTRPVDAARLLDIPYLCLHTPADNKVASYLQALFDRELPARLKEVVKLLKQIPEYQEAAGNNAGPKVLIGSDDQRTGRVFVDMTGGTSGSKETYEKLSQSGVGTIVGMHMSEEHRKEAEKHHIHVVIAGHISSDSLGFNLLLDEIEQSGPLTVVECSGFKRIRRQS